MKESYFKEEILERIEQTNQSFEKEMSGWKGRRVIDIHLY